MKQRIVYVWLPRIETDRILRTQNQLRNKPLAIATDTQRGSCLHAINVAAQAAGLSPGMMISAARTICPELITHPLDLRADQKFIAGIAKWCRSFTPLVARDGLHGLFLDVTGCAHLFGGEHTMLATLTARLRGETSNSATRDGLAGGIAQVQRGLAGGIAQVQRGLDGGIAQAQRGLAGGIAQSKIPQLAGFKLNAFTALADTAGAAWALARFGSRKTIAPCGQTASVIGQLPVAGLRIDADTTDMLNRLGFKKIEDLFGVARASLAARFGMELVSRLDQALGCMPEPLGFDREPKPYRTTVRFLEPIVLVKDVKTSLDHLLGRLCVELAKNSLGVRRLTLSLTRINGSTARLEIGTTAPSCSRNDLARLFQDKLETLDADFGFESITLHAAVVQVLDARQIVLTDDEAGSTASGERAALIDRLINRLGPGCLRAYAPDESHMPERAFKIHQPTAHEMTQTPFSPPTVPRPLRLYQRPIPIKAGKKSSTGVKVMNALGHDHIIRQMTGPERISSQWWHNEPVWSSDLREYWWVTNDAGQRFWIFKQHDKAGNNQWFLHGLSA